MLRALPYDPLWLPGEHSRWRRRRQRRLERCHPWGTAALALSGGRRQAGLKRLQRWLQSGITSDELAALAALPDGPFKDLEQALTRHAPMGHAPASRAPNGRPPQNGLPPQARLLPLGIALHDWQLHAWLQRLPLPAGFQLAPHQPADEQAQPWPLLVVQLEPIAPGAAGRDQIFLLLELAHACAVFDPDAERRRLLRRLGIQAIGIETAPPPQPQNDGQGNWLTAEQAALAAAKLGLPQPAALARLGEVLCLGRSREPGWTGLLCPPLLGLPGFDALEIHTWQEARSLASWLYHCLCEGPTLVRINPPIHELRKQGFRQLELASGRRLHTFVDPLHPAELLEELAWRQRGEPAEPVPSTPNPAARVLWRWEPTGGGAPEAAVCISLHNYRNRILTALESVARQDLEALELVVVDDASSDDGPALVQQWLELHGPRFRRALLLQHRANGGLASARNSAFRHARAPWCFVLDADNSLDPRAVSHCLQLAKAADPATAVVHPLISRQRDRDRPAGTSMPPTTPLTVPPTVTLETAAAKHLGPEDLLSVHSWQQRLFQQRNPVDAMALVRRSAWEAVGGYQHIPGGWEDYDFWCCLIDAGFHGILCPAALAHYTVHSSSMLHSSTSRRIRRISRLLQRRHPWLQLETARGSAEGRS